MIKTSTQLKELLEQFSLRRNELGIEENDFEKELVLGPGWLNDIESGKVSISLEMFFALLNASNISLGELSSGLENINSQEVPRNTWSEKNGDDITIFFNYAKHDAKYVLKNASTSQFDDVIRSLRNGLALLVSADDNSKMAIKTEAVAGAFNKAVSFWKDANPSDIWWFLIHRAFLDPFNHPAAFSRLSFEQSWKRTGGWALEEIVVRHYAPGLKKKGINIFIAPNEKRKELLAQAKVDHRLEADKADIFLTGYKDGKELFIGLVHVKASFAERRTDDVPMSQALVDAGYLSPLWTMDCKSTPSEEPFNKGELGDVKPDLGIDTRSAKRKDIEDDGYFSACFSYNKNTLPTPQDQGAKANIYVCDFSDPESDAFHNFICEGWGKFK